MTILARIQWHIDRIAEAVQDLVMATIEEAEKIDEAIGKKKYRKLVIYFLMVSIPFAGGYFLRGSDVSETNQVTDSVQLNAPNNGPIFNNSGNTTITEYPDPELVTTIATSSFQIENGSWVTGFALEFNSAFGVPLEGRKINRSLPCTDLEMSPEMLIGSEGADINTTRTMYTYCNSDKPITATSGLFRLID